MRSRLLDLQVAQSHARMALAHHNSTPMGIAALACQAFLGQLATSAFQRAQLCLPAPLVQSLAKMAFARPSSTAKDTHVIATLDLQVCLHAPHYFPDCKRDSEQLSSVIG